MKQAQDTMDFLFTEVRSHLVIDEM